MNNDQKEIAAYACHGLGFVQPIEDLAAWLKSTTGLTFTIVGNANPQLQQAGIQGMLKADLLKTKRILFISHSMGAMLAYYLPDSSIGDLSQSMMVSIDPTCWGSNINCAQWSLLPEYPGQWKAKTAAVWYNFSSGSYPGGGRMINPNEKTWRQFSFTDENHMSIVNADRTRAVILPAIKTFMGENTNEHDH